MKTIIITVTALIFSFGATAHNSKEHPEKYCAKMEGGKKVIMHQGSIITTEATLNNGTRIQPDGTILKKDGTKITLKEGECISQDGVIAIENEKKTKPK